MRAKDSEVFGYETLFCRDKVAERGAQAMFPMRRWQRHGETGRDAIGGRRDGEICHRAKQPLKNIASALETDGWSAAEAAEDEKGQPPRKRRRR